MIIKYMGKCTETAILSFENKYALSLPSDYSSFLRHSNGVIAKQGTAINISSLKNYIEIDSLFGLNCQRKWLDMEHWMDKYANELPPNTALIGRDILSGFLVLICSGESEGVYYWDTALNFEVSSNNSNAYYITKTFAEFLDQIQIKTNE